MSAIFWEARWPYHGPKRFIVMIVSLLNTCFLLVVPPYVSKYRSALIWIRSFTYFMYRYLFFFFILQNKLILMIGLAFLDFSFFMTLLSFQPGRGL